MKRVTGRVFKIINFKGASYNFELGFFVQVRNKTFNYRNYASNYLSRDINLLSLFSGAELTLPEDCGFILDPKAQAFSVSRIYVKW
jgi:hypothetical protein